MQCRRASRRYLTRQISSILAMSAMYAMFAPKHVARKGCETREWHACLDRYNVNIHLCEEEFWNFIPFRLPFSDCGEIWVDLSVFNQSKKIGWKKAHGRDTNGALCNFKYPRAWNDSSHKWPQTQSERKPTYLGSMILSLSSILRSVSLWWQPILLWHYYWHEQVAVRLSVPPS